MINMMKIVIEYPIKKQLENLALFITGPEPFTADKIIDISKRDTDENEN